MIFVIKTDDEVAGLDITAALSFAGIKHTILSKQNDEAAEQGVQSDVRQRRVRKEQIRKGAKPLTLAVIPTNIK